jgi:hypothetical protein
VDVEVGEGGFVEAAHSSVVEVISEFLFNTWRAYLKSVCWIQIICLTLLPSKFYVSLIPMPVDAVWCRSKLTWSDFVSEAASDGGDSWRTWNVWISSCTYLNKMQFCVP